MASNEQELIWNEDFGCWQLKEPVAKFDTGFIIELYRICEDLVVVEHIMVGRIHSFLEAYFVYTRSGLSICQSSAIRGHQFSKTTQLTRQVLEVKLLEIAKSEHANKRLANSLEVLYNEHLQKLSHSTVCYWHAMHLANC